MSSSSTNKKIMIIIYSVYGQVEKLAKEILEGINSIPGVKGEIWCVQETEKIVHSENYPILTNDKINDLTTADGFLFGVSIKDGMLPNQFKAFWDMTGGLWFSGALVGKCAGVFFSTGTQGSGQESVALTFIPHLAHHGIVYVPLGYTAGAKSEQEIQGGSPWGAGTFTGKDESKDPTELELKVAKHQGQYFAGFISKLKK